MIGKKVSKSLSFSDRLAKVKSMFVQAHDEAKGLSDAMKLDIETKEKAIWAIQDQIADVKAVKADTDAYVEKLEQFI